MTLRTTTEQDLALPENAFNDDGLAVLFISGGRYGGNWAMRAALTAGGEPCGQFWVLRGPGDSSADPRYPDRAVAAAIGWLKAQCALKSWRMLASENLNAEYGPGERPYFTLARAVIGGERFEPAPGIRYEDEEN